MQRDWPQLKYSRNFQSTKQQRDRRETNDSTQPKLAAKRARKPQPIVAHAARFDATHHPACEQVFGERDRFAEQNSSRVEYQEGFASVGAASMVENEINRDDRREKDRTGNQQAPTGTNAVGSKEDIIVHGFRRRRSWTCSGRLQILPLERRFVFRHGGPPLEGVRTLAQPAPAENQIVRIEDRRLARRYGALRLAEFDARSRGVEGCDLRLRRFMPIADAHQRLNRTIRLREWNPIHGANFRRRAAQ